MLRRLAGRTMVAASLMGWVLTLKDGTTVRNWLVRSTSPWLTKSWAVMTSIGTGDAVIERGSARVPTTATVSCRRISSSTSSVTMAPASTSTSRATVPKPGSVKVTSYNPGASMPSTNRPVPSVNAVLTSPLAWLRASTVTPGSTRPVASMTVPSMAASWAPAILGVLAMATRARKIKPQEQHLVVRSIHFPPCCKKSHGTA